MGGRGSAGTRGSTATLGSARVPTRDEILSGKATYGGLPVKYHAELTADAENFTTEIWVSDKFFEHPENIQQHVLNHEVAHNLSDELMAEHTGDWQSFTSKFIVEKEVPKTAPAYASGQRTYWEGLYGDIGSSAIKETTTRAITEYLDNPARLKERSAEAYKEIDRFVKRRAR